MLKEHGTFTEYSDPARSGVLLKNEDGDDWHRFVMLRVMFDDRGKVIKLYEDDHRTEIEGDRKFVNVRNGVVEFIANRDPSRLEPRGCLVIETDREVEVGMLYNGSRFLPAPPPPIVVQKGDIVSRLSDKQAENWEAKYGNATPKQRLTWENNVTFTQGSPEYQMVQSLFTDIFGPDGYEFFPK